MENNSSLPENGDTDELQSPLHVRSEKEADPHCNEILLLHSEEFLEPICKYVLRKSG